MGGRGVFAFLELPMSPRLAGLGGKIASISEEVSSGLGIYNPALIAPNAHGALEAGVSLYYANIRYDYASYFHNLYPVGMLGVSLRQVWYGRMVRRDEMGTEQGSFTAFDMTLGLHCARRLGEHWTLGLTLSPIYSKLAEYWAIGLTLDAAILYQSTDRLFDCALLLRNFGGSLKPYASSHREWAPPEILLGCSYTLEHAPLRFIVTLQNLESWGNRNIVGDSYRGNVTEKNTRQGVDLGKKILQEFLVHPIVGLEITPMRYFFLQVAYNYRRRSDLGLDNVPFVEGLSFGLGINVGRLKLHYSRAYYHQAGGTNHFSIAWQLTNPRKQTGPAPYGAQDAQLFSF